MSFPLLSLKVAATILDEVAKALLLVAVRRMGESMVGKRQKEMEERESRTAWVRGDIYRCVGWGRRVGWAER